MIKFNVGGKGLTHGLRAQVGRLVGALQPPAADEEEARAREEGTEGLGLQSLTVRLLNGNEHLDAEKRGVVRSREAVRGVDEVQTVLEPLRELRGVARTEITGAVTEEFVAELREAMARPFSAAEELAKLGKKTDALKALSEKISGQSFCYGE